MRQSIPYRGQMGAVNWTGLLQMVQPVATAEAIAFALGQVAGSRPQVINRGEYLEIVFDPEQEERVSQWIVGQLRKEPGNVRVDVGGIALKVVFRQYWPYILGAVAVGLAAGYFAPRPGRRRK